MYCDLIKSKSFFTYILNASFIFIHEVVSNFGIQQLHHWLSLIIFSSDLSEIKNGPKMTKFSESDAYVELKCVPPNSNPPAIIEWYRVNTKSQTGNTHLNIVSLGSI